MDQTPPLRKPPTQAELKRMAREFLALHAPSNLTHRSGRSRQRSRLALNPLLTGPAQYRGIAKTNLYVIGALGGPLKIGFSNDPDRRLKEMQTGHHDDLRIVYTLAVPLTEVQEIERTCHEHLSDHHVRGEWFRIGEQEAIAALKRIVNALVPD